MNRKVLLTATAAVICGALITIGVRTTTTTPEQPRSTEVCPEENAAACLTEWARTNIDDISLVIDVLTERTLTDSAFFTSSCHEVWHTVGEEAARHHPLVDLLGVWPYSCYGGLLHGAMSVAAPRMGVAEFSTVAPAFCATMRGRAPIVALDCWHGVGHGLASTLEYPESMRACAPLTRDEQELSWCTWGAAETHFDTYINNLGLRDAVDKQFPSTCESVTVGQAACLRMAGPVMLVSGYTFEDLYRYCATTTGEYAQWCAFSAGQVLATEWLVSGAEPRRCETAAELAASCAAGAGRNVGRVVELGTEAAADTHTGESPLALCSKFTTPALQQACTTSTAEIRELELSEAELRTVTEQWWDGAQRPSPPVAAGV